MYLNADINDAIVIPWLVTERTTKLIPKNPKSYMFTNIFTCYFSFQVFSQ